MKWYLLMLLAACATYPAGVRRMAESKLKFCRQGRVSAPLCYEEAKRYCLARGLESTCAEGFQ